MATQAQKPKPAATFRSGGVKATVWLNNGANGSFYNFTVARPFKDGEGNWKNSGSFGVNDADGLTAVTAQAKQWMADRATR